MLIAILLILNYGLSSAAGVFLGQTRLVPIYRVDRQDKQIAITFDAAWGADKTQDILSVLKEYDVKATFFLVAFWAEDYPEMVKAIQDSGMEIGTHSANHPDMAKLSREKIKEELEGSIKAIENLTGKKPTLFRAPFGSYNNALIEEAQSLNLKTIQWDVDTLDWKGYTPAKIMERVKKNLKSGSIILMHNNSDHVVEALRQILDYAKSEGYKVTSVGELIYQDNYTINRNGEQKQS